jgi:hypothetical protein
MFVSEEACIGMSSSGSQWEVGEAAEDAVQQLSGLQAMHS